MGATFLLRHEDISILKGGDNLCLGLQPKNAMPNQPKGGKRGEDILSLKKVKNPAADMY